MNRRWIWGAGAFVSALFGCGSDPTAIIPTDGDAGMDGGVIASPGDVPIEGTVSGLDGELVLALGDEQLTVDDNGPFEFDTDLNDGDDYEVTVATHPEGQFCSLADADGTVNEDSPPRVRVECDDAVSGLVGLSATMGELSPAFQPGVTRYRLDVPAWVERVRLRPEAADGVTLESDGEAMGSSVLIDLSDDMQTLDFTATTDSGQVIDYSVDAYRARRVIEATYLKASEPHDSARLGYAMAVSGNTLVVAAPGDPNPQRGINPGEGDESAPDTGAVYVFAMSDDGWKQQALLKADNADEGDLFGFSVAIDGDTVVVGAPGESGDSAGVNGDGDDNSLGESGAAYVFQRDDDEWEQVAYLKGTAPNFADRFGRSVAVLGDVIAVGALGQASDSLGVDGDDEDDSLPASGAVYVFERDDDGAWESGAFLKASNADAGDAFGYSLALGGQAGSEWIAVGATGESSSDEGVDADQDDNDATSAGAVYVFGRDGESWAQEAYLKASNAGEGDFFGYALSVYGSRLAVGAPFEASASTGLDSPEDTDSLVDAGAAYLFARSDGEWEQELYLKPSNTGEGDRFGLSLHLQSDALIVGAPGEASAEREIDGDESNDDKQAVGAAYVFSRGADGWDQYVYLKASNADGADNFGSAVALGPSFAAVGAQFEKNEAGGIKDRTGSAEPLSNNALRNSGAVYEFR